MAITRKAIRANWIKRLRSGKYKQGYFWLNANDKYCCLGVLCEFLVEKGILEKSKGEIAMYMDSETATKTGLPPKAIKVAGLTSSEGRSAKYYWDGSKKLVTLNDDLNMSFDKIADALETGEYWVENK